MLYSACCEQLIDVHIVESEVGATISFSALVPYERSPSHDSIDRPRVAYPHGRLQSLDIHQADG